ncbi:MAG TPA: hypothetical protein VK453_18075 [Micromonosporaceae bacterium]|nr:hypothetical protein [Micromonosporaceae bacterium]
MARGRTAVVAVLLGATVLAGAGGCEARSANAAKVPISSSVPEVPPASSAGGACHLLDYDQIAEVLGARFAVAAAGRQHDTYTCVVQAAGASFPDLMIGVTATVADRAAFDVAVRPAGAAAVGSLGLAAYSLTAPPMGGAGPGSTVGWLTGNGRLIVLAYRLPPTASAADAGAMTPKLVTLAQQIDFASS